MSHRPKAPDRVERIAAGAVSKARGWSSRTVCRHAAVLAVAAATQGPGNAACGQVFIPDTPIAIVAAERPYPRPQSQTQSPTWIPEEVDLVLEIRDLAAWWDRPGVRELTAMLERRLAMSELGELWAGLADASGLAGRELASRLVSEELVLGLPVDARKGEVWIARMKVEDGVRREILSRLPLRPLGGGRYELRGQDLVLVDRPPHLLAGPAAVVARLPRQEAGFTAPRSADADESIVEIEVRRGFAMAPLRLAASLDGPAIAIRGLQRDRDASVESTLELDPALRRTLRELRGRHAAVVATVAGGPFPVGLEWIAVVPELAVPPSLGANARERRVWTIGETCGDATDRWRAHATPAIAAAFEVGDADEGRRRLAAWAEGLAGAIDRRLEDLSLPRLEVLRTVDGGTIPLAPITRGLLGGHALAERIRIDWSSASGPSGEWAIVGTGGSYLRDVRDAFEPIVPAEASLDRLSGEAAELGRDSENEPGVAAGWRLVQVGWVDAERVSGHLGHWCDRGLDLFDPGRADRMRPRLERMLEASSTLRRIRWSIEENASGDRRFEIHLEPREAESFERSSRPAPAP